MIQLTTGDAEAFSAYRADPAGTPKGAVVILPEVLGLNAHIRKVADDFAAKGYVAVAPSLFDKVRPNVELADDDAGLAEGNSLKENVGTEWSLSAIQATVDAVKAAGKVAVVGYDWGGYLAFLSANQVNGIACAISYYGDGVTDQQRGKCKVPTLLHFGEDDSVIPFEDVTLFRAARPDVSAFSYPGAGHGFDREGSKGYQKEGAEKADERTAVWIAQFVEGQPPVPMKNQGAYALAKTDKKKKKNDDMGPPMD